MNTLYYFKNTDRPGTPDTLLGIFDIDNNNTLHHHSEFEKIREYSSARIGFLKSEGFQGNIYHKLLNPLLIEIESYEFKRSSFGQRVGSVGQTHSATMIPKMDPRNHIIYAQKIPINTFLVDRLQTCSIQLICGVGSLDTIQHHLSDGVYLLRYA